MTYLLRTPKIASFLTNQHVRVMSFDSNIALENLLNFKYQQTTYSNWTLRLWPYIKSISFEKNNQQKATTIDCIFSETINTSAGKINKLPFNQTDIEEALQNATKLENNEYGLTLSKVIAKEKTVSSFPFWYVIDMFGLDKVSYNLLLVFDENNNLNRLKFEEAFPRGKKTSLFEMNNIEAIGNKQSAHLQNSNIEKRENRYDF